MKIRMLSTHRGSPDGATVLVYEKGHEYDLGSTARADDLAQVFIRHGWAEDAELAQEEKAASAAGPKAVQSSPENKDARTKPRRGG